MIKIFNRKIDSEILIDENVPWIQFYPRDYEEVPHVIIEMKDFNFFKHSNNCNDCNKFLNSFGKESVDWYISYNCKIFRLSTSEIGSGKYLSNKITLFDSPYFSGTKITLLFNELPTDKNELQKLLDESLINEEYEKSCLLRDLINE